MEPRYTGTCGLCGEEDVEIFASDYLPDDLEGSACQSCCKMYEDEAESRAAIEREQRLDRFEDAFADAALHGDFD